MPLLCSLASPPFRPDLFPSRRGPAGGGLLFVEVELREGRADGAGEAEADFGGGDGLSPPEAAVPDGFALGEFHPFAVFPCVESPGVHPLAEREVFPEIHHVEGGLFREAELQGGGGDASSQDQ